MTIIITRIRVTQKKILGLGYYDAWSEKKYELGEYEFNK